MKDGNKSKFINSIPAIIGIVICVILAPLLIMNITIIIKSYINPDKTPDFFGIKPFIVVTGSMEDEICAGDLAVIKTVDPNRLKEGDIISFKEGESVVIHRIVQLTERDGHPAFVTKGDANNVQDSNFVTYRQIEGVYMFRIAKLGHIAMFMQTPLGMTLFIVVPVCGFAVYDIIRRGLNEKKEEKIT